MTGERQVALLAFLDSATAQLFENTLSADGFQVFRAGNAAMLLREVQDLSPTLLVIEASFVEQENKNVLQKVRQQLPALPILYFTTNADTQVVLDAIRDGANDVLIPPLRRDDLHSAVQRAVAFQQQVGDWLRQEVRRTTASLRQYNDMLESLLKIGQEIMGDLRLENVLERIVSEAVRMLKAEEGTLMLLDEESNTLYVRASKNFDQNLAHTMRLPVQDSLAGQVLQTAQPLVISSEKAQKIKTAYLVHSLVYVPLMRRGRAFGVLGVDNRLAARDFSPEQVTLLSILAGYAAVAIENARLYEQIMQERNKLEAVFQNIQNGVLIIDYSHRIVLMNPAARRAFNLPRDLDIAGRPFDELIENDDLAALLSRTEKDALTYHEINTNDGNVYSAYYTPIPGIGAAITLHDITYLKDLDQLKTDFIHTVSHDLRSPLTAVLGYAELLERVGRLEPQQAEFVSRIKQSVQSITDLVNELLDLGRIESGFDTRKEQVQLTGVLDYVLDGMKLQIEQKRQKLSVEVGENLPAIRGNPIRLRQIMDNLIGNAVKYTPEEGEIKVRLFMADDQIVFEVSDNGPGIPLEDQPHIFEKFYRGRNETNTTGSGLGLAIVKSIVESHNGRIWVNSLPGKGTTFTVVLPVANS